MNPPKNRQSTHKWPLLSFAVSALTLATGAVLQINADTNPTLIYVSAGLALMSLALFLFVILQREISANILTKIKNVDTRALDSISKVNELEESIVKSLGVVNRSFMQANSDSHGRANALRAAVEEIKHSVDLTRGQIIQKTASTPNKDSLIEKDIHNLEKSFNVKLADLVRSLGVINRNISKIGTISASSENPQLLHLHNQIEEMQFQQLLISQTIMQMLQANESIEVPNNLGEKDKA